VEGDVVEKLREPVLARRVGDGHDHFSLRPQRNRRRDQVRDDVFEIEVNMTSIE
jgi:hypothetical protein